MAYVFLDPADYIVGKPISFEEYAQLVENANQAYGAGTNHGEIFATRAAVTTVNASVSGSVPGPYTWVVPSGITQVAIEICGGGGGGSTSGVSGNAGGNSTVSGSVSGSLVTANGGGGGAAASGAGGAASGFCVAGNTTTTTSGAPCPSPFFGGVSLSDALLYFGHFGGLNGVGTGINGTGFGNGASNSGGTRKGGGSSASGSSMITVVPGETLTLTVGAGGAGAPSGGTPGGDGAPGMIRLRW